jgi:hypothetical protein
MSRISFRKQAADAKKKEKRQRKQKNAMNEGRLRFADKSEQSKENSNAEL